ncbi:uracil-DNA glycosylase family protein [Catalinimonas niigatensis]|uniref:uracil-DNA glycosylase family protein n=1 Tax=Catalinimonas niigatensis TaxID=1397264 RepID=UPI0026660E73|nr:uracil-DNA glycosylase family protein [Catalinimonas niigatensis]WPP49227.1 uracil-DNA glycosylase family protein [Catalinimonas niigatensis]
MEDLLKDIRKCIVCEPFLPLGARPVLSAHPRSRILIVGQAPGTRVHHSGIPWNDQSGKTLRAWLNVSDKEFYTEEKFGIVPMGFCYPGSMSGKAKSGDLPPRKECAPLWHAALLERMPEVQLTLLIGQYAQKYYLGKQARKNLTETVQSFEEYLPRFFPLPHPSPRNRIWIKKNPWFEEIIVPQLQYHVKKILH